MELLISWLVLTFAVFVTAEALPGFHVKDFKSALFVAAIYGVLNAFLGSIIFGVLTIATLGLAYLLSFITVWFVNAIMLTLTDKLTDKLTIDSFGWALGGAFMISLMSNIGIWLLAFIF
jgi:putative membrane protein